MGMGKELYEKLPAAARLLDKANDVLGYDLRTIIFNGPQETLTDTKYAQPAIYTCSAMYLEKFKADGLDYDYTAGHSLGEYDALLAANVFDFETGLKLVAARGLAMSKMNGKGSMAAVMGLSEAELASVLELVPDAVMANINSKTQIVISGTEEAVNAVGVKIAARDDVKFTKLRVSAAFHSPQMRDAADEMKFMIEAANFNAPACYVVSNVTGKPTMNLAEIKANLISQITGQVRWADTILAMKEAGVTMLYEVGYGDVLKKLNKTITFRPKCVGVEI
ncbi:MAG: ACP S-malonyltransferase [Synergistaceae bacterium]|nr:ACP S-malonyltransferase [Synergistaceae bacterium]MBR1417386.1 ACP S-malonyltransferase [Synergistaceae bacterium]